MKKVLLFIIPLVIVLGVAGAVIFIVQRKGAPPREPDSAAAQQESVESSAALPTETVTLFFQDPDEELLIPEKRNIYSMPLLTDRAKQVIVELIRGPAMGGIATVPEGTSLIELYFLESGVAYVDLSREFETDAVGGSSSQLAQIYSLVNSLTYNFPEIKWIRILIEGQEKVSFGGHLCLTGAFGERLAMVKFTEPAPPPAGEEPEAIVPEGEAVGTQTGTETDQHGEEQPDATQEEESDGTDRSI